MKITLLAGNTLRSRAYAQVLSGIAGIEVSGLFCGFASKPCKGEIASAETTAFFNSIQLAVPDLSITLEKTFEINKWEFLQIDTPDVNDDKVVELINKKQSDLIIFSGYGGQILKPQHFSGAIPYLHMHPGALPEERGSTTIYYSILNGRACTVSAFFMTAEIDAGKLVVEKSYPVPPKAVSIDTWYDNSIRADCLKRAIMYLLSNGFNLPEPKSSTSDAEYFVIHPVLKHIALLSLRN